MVYRFLDFELDEDRFELRRGREVIPTQPRVFKLLAHLAQRAQRVVTRSELIDTVWERTAVTETAISQVVMLARKALGDEQQEIIKTLRGQGFRLMAEVRSESPTRTSTAPAMTPAPSRPPPRRSLLTSRERVLAELARYVERSDRGEGALVLIDGEPGVGKSWLMEELAARVVEHGGEVLWGRSWAAGDAPALWPWVDVLRGLLEPLRGSLSLYERLGPGFDEVLGLLPECEAGRTSPVNLAPRDPTSPNVRVQLLDATTRLVRTLCGRRATTSEGERPPLRVVVLEDLDAFDDGSLQLLRWLSRRLSDLRLLVVGTYRSLPQPRARELGALIRELTDAAQHIQLAALSEREVGMLLEASFGEAVPARWVSVVHRLSFGNPLLVHALARSLPRHEAGRLEELPELASFVVPERIANAVHSCLDVLPVETRDLLSRASVIGQEFSLALLSHLLNATESALLEGLGPALQQEVLRHSALKPGHFVFAQAVVQSAVYHGTPHALRVEQHRSIGELLERSQAAQAPVHELAHHFLLAASAGSRAKAIAYARAAADASYAEASFETAAALYDRAFDLSMLESVASSEVRELLTRAGEAWYRAGELDLACKRFDRAAYLAQAAGDSLARAWSVARSIHVGRAALLLDDSVPQRLRDAFDKQPVSDDAAGAMVLGFQAIGRQTSGWHERDAITRQAVDVARSSGDDAVLTWTLSMRHLVLSGYASPAILTALARELVERSRNQADHELLLDNLLHHVLDSLQLGDLPAAMRSRAEHRAALERWGTPFHRYMSVACEAAEATMAGSFAWGALHSARAAELGARLDPGAGLNHAVRTFFAHVYYGFGDGAVAERAFDEVPAAYRPFWGLAWIRGERIEDARRVVSATAATGLHQPVLALLRRPTWAVLGELAAELGQLDLAREVYTLLAPEAGTHLALHAGVYLGPVSYYLAVIAAAEGLRERAERHFQAAFDEALSVAALPFVARMRHTYGRWLTGQAPNERRSGEVLRAATHLARGLGVTLANSQFETGSPRKARLR